MKPKTKLTNLTKEQKLLLREFFSNPFVQKPLFSYDLFKITESFRKRFVKQAKESDSIKLFGSAPVQNLLIDIARKIDARVEVLFGIFISFAEEESLPWDERMLGPYLLNIAIVLQANALFIKITQLMSERELKVEALLSLYFKLGMYIESFQSIKLLNAATAKFESLADCSSGGKATAKLRPNNIPEITLLVKELNTIDKKRKQLYEDITAKWNAKNSEKSVCVRTMQAFLKKNGLL